MFCVLGGTQYDPDLECDLPFTSAPSEVMLAYQKYQWSIGDDLRRREAFHRLQVCLAQLIHIVQLQLQMFSIKEKFPLMFI